MARRATRRRILGAGTIGLTVSIASLSANNGNIDEQTTSTNITDTAEDDPPPDSDATTDEGDDDTSDDEAPDPPANSAVVFVYDDGSMEDYTQAFPVHQEFDAPATTGIVSEWIGREDYMDNGCMDVEHLAILADAGWEIALIRSNIPRWACSDSSRTPTRTTSGSILRRSDMAITEERSLN